MIVKDAVREANPQEHQGDHVCVDGRQYRAGGTCLVTDKAWQMNTYGCVVNEALVTDASGT